MKIYQVYISSTAESACFKTKKGAKKYIKAYYEEQDDEIMSLADFILDQGIEINKIPLNK